MKGSNLFYGVIFGISLLVLLSIPFVIGEDVTSSVTVSGAAPVVGPMSTSDNIALSSCGTVLIWCNATVTDSNGWNDIDLVNSTLWDDAAANEGDSDNNSNHYTNYSCYFSGSGSTAEANCSFTLLYYANPAEWTCKIYANDTASNVSSNSTANVTVNTLRALDANNTIDFTSLAPGATSPSDVNNTVMNCGNAAIDLNLSGTNLTNASATVTNISVTNVKYNMTDYAQDYAANMTSLTTTTTYADYSLVKRTNGLSISDTYWKISIPGSIETLTYTGTINFTAVADT
ncbi:MAG: hypothetical protein JSV39_01140 [Candidatus Aenigmatarchaeota archaeon]|nr:MAG: hypothetical protein JSV39_01140 [Candidatus Aenigmarchaeota archaeon]